MFAPRFASAILTLTLVLAGVVFVAPVEAQATTDIEDFESYDAGSLPCTPQSFVAPCTTAKGFAYTQTAGSYQVSASHFYPDSGTQGFAVNGQSYFGSGGQNLCAEPVRVSMKGLNGANFMVIGAVTPDGSTSSRSYDFFFFSLAPGGQGYAALRATNFVNSGSGTVVGQTANMIFTNSFSANTWYDFTIYCHGEANAGSMTLYSPQAAAIGNAPVSSSVGANAGTNYQVSQYLRLVGGASQYFDNIETVKLSTVETTPNGPELTVVGLTGMDVDSSGTTLIIRTHDAAGNTQDNVRTYSAATLATPGNVENSECNRLRGVTAMREYVAFLECNDGEETDVDFVKIRDANLGPPDRPQLCDSGFCTADIDANELAGDQSAAYEIAGIQEFPFDYSENCDDFLCGDGQVYTAFAFSFTDGYVGVATYTWNNNADDKSQIQRISVGPTDTVADQICTVQDTDGQSYLYAANSDAQAKGFSVDFTVDHGVIAAGTVAVNLQEVFSGSAITSGPMGIACGENRFAVITGTTLSVWERGANTPICTRTVASVPSAGLTMSGDGEWVAWIEGTTMRVGSANPNGSPANANRDAVAACGAVATAEIPTGTFVQIDTDGTAQIVWIATTVRVRANNAVYLLTTGNATACNPGDIGCGPGGSSTATGTSGAGSGVFGFGATGNLIAALATVVGFLVIGYAMTSRRRTNDDESEDD
jgi:hypothetical protein